MCPTFSILFSRTTTIYRAQSDRLSVKESLFTFNHPSWLTFCIPNPPYPRPVQPLRKGHFPGGNIKSLFLLSKKFIVAKQKDISLFATQSKTLSVVGGRNRPEFRELKGRKVREHGQTTTIGTKVPAAHTGGNRESTTTSTAEEQEISGHLVSRVIQWATWLHNTTTSSELSTLLLRLVSLRVSLLLQRSCKFSDRLFRSCSAIRITRSLVQLKHWNG